MLLLFVGLVSLALLGVAGTGLRSPAEVEPVSTADSLPPWPAPVDPAAGERAAGLTVLPAEGVVQHIHSHLDILVNGSAVPVPANLGIDVRRGLYAELHTHADSGVLHIESSDKNARFVLGQLFTEWNVQLDATHLGGLEAGNGHQLYVYLDGGPYSGDPAAIRLADQQEIVLAYGSRPPTTVPASFDFKHHPV